VVADDPVALGQQILSELAAHPPDAFASAKAAMLVPPPEQPEGAFAAMLPSWTRPRTRERMLARIKR
jgi:hypothetical protein